MTENQFVGTWRLVSWENRDENGQVTHPVGQDAIGYLMYSADGYMSAQIMMANRTKFASGDLFGGSTDELVEAAKTYIAACGSYDIYSDKVVHHLETVIFPNWSGKDEERFYEFKDNQLLLKTPPKLMAGKQQVGYVTWERVDQK